MINTDQPIGVYNREVPLYPPRSHIIDAKEVAYVIAFLASPKSISINGDAITADGGTPRAIHYSSAKIIIYAGFLAHERTAPIGTPIIPSCS